MFSQLNYPKNAVCLGIITTMCMSAPISANTKVNTYIDNGNGSVTETATGLIWQQQDDNTIRNYVTAITYCQNLSLAGMNDWRVPHIKELASIADYRIDLPTIDSLVFPNTNNSFYRTVTDQASNINNAWALNFSDRIVATTNKSTLNFVRCVHQKP